MSSSGSDFNAEAITDFDEVIHGDRPQRPRRRGSTLDEWWLRYSTEPAVYRLWHWGAPIAVTLVAAATRLYNLGDPHALMFDETYYVKDAWTLSHLGYEGSWPADADTAFNAGNPNGYLKAGSFVVHPPLGKWIISLGMTLLGGESSVGWRISTALAGIIAVVLIMLIAKRLFRSTLLAVIAGGLLAVDGTAIVMSRVSLLDNFVMLFALCGFGALLLDRTWTQARLDRWMSKHPYARFGPALWWRPWLILCGLSLGLASAVKWNGFYFLGVFAVYSLLSDLLARRRAGIQFWGFGTIAKQGPVNFLLIVPLAIATFFASWTGWFVTRGGFYRNWVQEGNPAWTGALRWVPISFQNWWHYQVDIYNFNVGLRTPHAYEANPLTWLFMVRPTYIYEYNSPDGLSATQLRELSNPLIWWACTTAVFYLVYRLVKYREWRVGFILTGMAAGYLPWLLYLDRTVFQFYTIAFEPYMILALTFVLGQIVGSSSDSRRNRTSGLRLVGSYLGLVIVVSVFFWPMLAAIPEPNWLVPLHFWLPSWN